MQVRRPAAFASVVALAAVATAARADPPAGVALSRASRIVAGGGLLAITDGSSARVIALDGGGKTVASFGGELAEGDGRSAGAPAMSGGARAEAAAVLDAFDVPAWERGSPDAEALVEDESRLSRRRAEAAAARAPATAPRSRGPKPPRDRLIVAASEAGVLVAVGPRIVLVRPDGTRAPTAHFEAPPDALAAADDGGAVVALGARVLVAAAGEAPRHVVTAGARVDALAVSADGREIAWIAEGALHVTDARRRSLPVAVMHATSLHRCGGVFVAAAPGRLVVHHRRSPWTPSSLPPGTERFRCGGGPWIAWGVAAAAVSFDEGATWHALDADATGALALADDLWPEPDGLWRLAAGTLDWSPYRQLGRGPLLSPPARPSFTRVEPWPWWPRLVAQGTVRRSDRREIAGVLLAELPLGAPAPPASPAAQGPPPTLSPLAFPPLPARDRACLAETHRRAVALALAEPERARSYLRRARIAGWLPEVRVRVEARKGRSESLDLDRKVAAAASPIGIDTDDDVLYEARVTWDLARLAFSPEELAAQAQAVRMADARRETETLVTRLHFERRRLLMEPTLLPDLSDEEPAAGLRRHVRIEEISALLDAISDGTYGRCAAEPQR